MSPYPTRRPRRPLLTTALVLSLCSGATLAQELVSNGSFEEGTCVVPTWITLATPGPSCLTDWDVSSAPGGGVELIHTIWVSSDGEYSVELANFGAAGGIEQVLSPTVPGQQYRLTFDLAGQPGFGGGVKHMRVDVGGGQIADFSFDATGKTATNMGWQKKGWCFTADDTSTTLRFISTNVISPYNAAIDNISVVPVTQELIVNGSFEEGTCVVPTWITLPTPGPSCLTGWDVSSTPGGGVELIHTIWDSSDGEYSVELANFAATGGVEQLLSPTVVDQEYLVCFDLAGQPGFGGGVKHMRVEVDNGQGADFSFDATGKTATDMGWESKAWTFTATSTSTTIKFLATDVISAYNAAVDNISVTPIGETLLSNGSFELGTCVVPTWTTLLSGPNCLDDWIVSGPPNGGGVELIHTIWTSSEGEYSLELANFAAAGGIEQLLSPTVPGQRYRVIFDMAGQPSAGGGVKSLRSEVLGGPFADFSFDTTGTTSSEMGWETKKWSFTATSTSTTIRFLATDVTTVYNAAVDNIRVVPVYDCTWFDVGCALPGTLGNPLLYGTGPLGSGTANVLNLVNAAPSAPAFLFLGLSGGAVPFKGGVLKPFPFFDLPIFSTSPAGTFVLPFVLPTVPANAEIWTQWAIQDGGAIHGVALSNALLGVTQ